MSDGDGHSADGHGDNGDGDTAPDGRGGLDVTRLPTRADLVEPSRASRLLRHHVTGVPGA